MQAFQSFNALMNRLFSCRATEDKLCGPMPFVITRKHLPLLENYYKTFKADGIRCVLFSYQKKLYYFSNLDKKLWCEQTNWPEGTACYGEDIGDHIVLFDIVSLDTFRKRYEQLEALDLPDNVSVKGMTVSGNPQQYKTDGIILIHKDSLFFPDRDQLLKWKPVHTIDFKIVLKGKMVWFFTDGTYPQYKQLNNGAFKGNMNGKVVECEYNMETHEFVPLKIREDKYRGNSSNVAMDTILAMVDNIRKTELI